MQEELTVRVEHPELPAIRWNEAEVQQNLTEMLAAYTGRVYTPETIKDAKADRAAVNKLDKQLSDAARSAKAFYMKPLEEFLQSAKQMQGQCKAVSGAIDQQVKAVEEAERQDKQDALRAVYADCIGELRELIPFDRLLVPQWLNKTYDHQGCQGRPRSREQAGQAALGCCPQCKGLLHEAAGRVLAERQADAGPV